MTAINTATVTPLELVSLTPDLAPGQHIAIASIAIDAQVNYLQGFADGVASVPTVVEPTLDSFIPANGLNLGVNRNTAKYTPLSFRVVNPSARRFSIWLKFRNSIFGSLVYDSVVGFLPPFNNVASTYILGTGAMTILQQSGWQDNIEGVFLGGRADAAIVPVRPGGPGSSNPPNAP